MEENQEYRNHMAVINNLLKFDLKHLDGDRKYPFLILCKELDKFHGEVALTKASLKVAKDRQTEI